jgi:hypothetical protein
VHCHQTQRFDNDANSKTQERISCLMFVSSWLSHRRLNALEENSEKSGRAPSFAQPQFSRYPDCSLSICMGPPSTVLQALRTQDEGSRTAEYRESHLPLNSIHSLISVWSITSTRLCDVGQVLDPRPQVHSHDHPRGPRSQPPGRAIETHDPPAAV